MYSVHYNGLVWLIQVSFDSSGMSPIVPWLISHILNRNTLQLHILYWAVVQVSPQVVGGINEAQKSNYTKPQIGTDYILTGQCLLQVRSLSLADCKRLTMSRNDAKDYSGTS